MARLPLLAVAAGVFLLAAHAFPWNAAPQDTTLAAPAQTSSLTAPTTLIDIYCAGCHNNGRSKIDFDGLVDVQSIRRHRTTGKNMSRLRRTVVNHTMGQLSIT